MYTLTANQPREARITTVDIVNAHNNALLLTGSGELFEPVENCEPSFQYLDSTMPRCSSTETEVAPCIVNPELNSHWNVPIALHAISFLFLDDSDS